MMSASWEISCPGWQAAEPTAYAHTALSNAHAGAAYALHA